MSKKTKRAKLIRPMRQLQQRPAVPPQVHEQLANRAHYARQQLLDGDFVGAVSTCKSLLKLLSTHSALRVEVLIFLGLAHSMLQHHQESYDVLNEAISIDPGNPELWYNQGVTCDHLGRYAESVRAYERAVELFDGDDTSGVAHKAAKELASGRRQLQEVMETYGQDITLEEYAEREEMFAQALNLMRQEKWSEAERIFRQLIELGSRIPSYWGNLGVSLMMQSRYDESEEALKQALAIDPDYYFARDNLQKLPEARLGKIPLGIKVYLQTPDEKPVRQALTVYQHSADGTSVASTTVERGQKGVTTTVWSRLGAQPPCYDFFLNHHQDARFTTCPRCEMETQPLTCTLLVKVHPAYAMIADQQCRYCSDCDLLIAHQDELEEKLVTHLLQTDNAHLIGNDYRVVGTLDKAEWDQVKQDSFSYEQALTYLHDFKDVVRFERVSQ